MVFFVSTKFCIFHYLSYDFDENLIIYILLQLEEVENYSVKKIIKGMIHNLVMRVSIKSDIASLLKLMSFLTW